MKIDIVISDKRHPMLSPIRAWRRRHAGVDVKILHKLAGAKGGDALVLVACHEIAKPKILARYTATYVTHESDLPKGRGWSPLVWTVLKGGKTIVVSLIEAAEPVDSGRVYKKFRFAIRQTDIWSDINAKLAKVMLRCLDFVIENDGRPPRVRQKGKPSFYLRRRPEDSRLDPWKTIAEQFNLLRICDPVRFPAFFDHHGERFELIIRKTRK